MRQLVIILAIVALIKSSETQYPSCIDNCPIGTNPLSPLSYNTIRSHPFSGTQPNNGGCSDGASVDGQVTTDCGQGTALLDCDSNFNGGNFSALSNLTIFTWNRTPLVSNRVSIIFSFTQQSIINVIRMFFWNSTSDAINIPSVRIFWSDDNNRAPNPFITTGSTTDGSGSGQRIMTINGSNSKLHYLRIMMSFPDNHGWIFLSEVQFCGSAAPYHITQPSTDNYEQRISPNATTANITCALSISIGIRFIVTWRHNRDTFVNPTPPNSVIQSGTAISLLIRDLQPSDLGVYVCAFIDINTPWRLRRTITLVVKTECTHLSVPANGRIVSCSSGTAGMGFEGDTCSFTCNASYELTGSDTRTCQSDGSWSGSDAVCTETTCPTLTNPGNGIINCSLGDDGLPSYEDTCDFTCNTGYELTGSDTRTCQSDGSWSGSDVVCIQVSCPPLINPPMINNRMINCSLGDDGIPSYEDTCSFTCNTGYELTGSDTRTCQSDGSWSGSDTVCSQVACLRLTSIDDGMINCSLGDDGVSSYEDTCSYTCNTGYELTGSETRTCQSDGRWNGSDAVCRRVSCQPLIDPSEGAINCSLGDDGVPSYEDTCSYTCNTGYELTGSDTRTCQSDGSWSNSDTMCRRVLCPTLTNPSNGLINCSLGDDGVPFYEDTCSFICNTSYGLTGSDTRTCQSNGSWSGSETLCKELQEVQCPPPINGNLHCPNGATVGALGDTCTFSCKLGFDLEGSSVGKCLASQGWSGSPVCVAKREISCMTYQPAGICRDFQSEFDHPVKIAVNTSDGIETSEFTIGLFYNLLTSQLQVHKQCLNALLPFICRWVFPTCDPAFNISVEQYTCRRTCEIFTNFVCNEVWLFVLSQLEILHFHGVNVPVCDDLDRVNGGDVPDCIDTLQGGEIPVFIVTGDCFNGRGRGYNGTISRTRSGRTCQRWSEQAPHQFILPSSQYPEIAGGHNYCRNPGSRAPDGPWCFTTDPNTRWEYCDVPKCEPSPSCELYYNTSDGICFKYGSIGMDYVFLNNSVNNMKTLNSKLLNFNGTLHSKVETEGYPVECIDLMLGLMCHHSFPLCDYTSNTPVPRQVCSSYCEEVRTGKCDGLWRELDALSSLAVIRLPDCKTLPSPEGGDYLECFIPYNNGRARRDINSTDCYTEEDLGIHYNGALNVTESGRTCQKWDSDTPHSHPITSLHRYYLEDHNYCRNPEGRGKRPWCYTMDPAVRWEYCNVPNCAATPDSAATTPDSVTATPDSVTATSTSSNAVIAVAVVIPVLIVLLLTIIVIIIILRRATREKQQLPYPIKPHVAKGDESCVNNEYYDPMLLNYEKLPNVPRENITYIGDLGEGNFGMVMKGEAIGITPKEPSTLVAIKVLREGSNKDAKNDFIKEAVHMNQFDHPNILKLLGVCFDKEPLCLIFEYMDLGDLNRYLRRTAVSCSRSSSTLTVQQLADMAIHIAAGLEYLAVRHFVHRDLATRNCLINEKLFVKISDFGLSKDVYCKDYYKLGEKSVLPIRWMPPEAILYSTFTTQSDVWSFGIVLWEIFSSGTQPYCALSNEEVVERVTNGQILRCPSGCPNELYSIMIRCWASEPKERPTASEVYNDLVKWSPPNDTAKYEQPPGYVFMKSSVSSPPEETSLGETPPGDGEATPLQLEETTV